ncbi:MAG: hypothetical protein ACI81W_003775, partial [Saprospiraceae bacterium]
GGFCGKFTGVGESAVCFCYLRFGISKFSLASFLSLQKKNFQISNYKDRVRLVRSEAEVLLTAHSNFFRKIYLSPQTHALPKFAV